MIRPSMLIAAMLTLAAARVAAQDAPASAQPRPSLVVLITVDQMRADYLDRFGSQLTGGLARLAGGGARYTNAHHDHAITETAPGHATLLSGRFPRSTGILANAVGVGDDSSALLDAADGPGASPRRFRGTTLVDWIRTAEPRSRALSISGKDRSAILPIGRSKQQVYWYVPDGRFITSRYYADTLPTWVHAFNARDLARRRAGQSWRLLLPDSAYPEPDSVVFEAGAVDAVFPHVVPDDSARAADYVRVTPWIDEIVLAMALAGLDATGIGTGTHTDLLSVSLSGTDFIGHRYGPDSREMRDQILRVDRSLDGFIDSLYSVRDSSRVAIIFTSDHGVGSIPELAAQRAGPEAKDVPLRVDLRTALERGRTLLRNAEVDERALWLDGGIIGLDPAAIVGTRVNAGAVITRVLQDARAMPGVLRVDRWSDLARATRSRDTIARRWAHQFTREASLDLVVTLTPGSVYGMSIATHGTPHDYDSHVPLIFYGPRFLPGSHHQFVRTVDIAPTIAAMLGVRPTEALDGEVLRGALRP